MKTRDYRILPGNGKATVATLCDFYRELMGGRVVQKKVGAEPCEYYELNPKLGYCTHYFCPMCSYLMSTGEVKNG
jgi:hypothetical protein